MSPFPGIDREIEREGISPCFGVSRYGNHVIRGELLLDLMVLMLAVHMLKVSGLVRANFSLQTLAVMNTQNSGVSCLLFFYRSFLNRKYGRQIGPAGNERF